MLSIFLLHIVITFTCLLSGFLFYTTFDRNSVTKGYKPVIVYLITGLFIIAVLYQSLILFFPVNFYLKILVWLFPATGGFLYRKKCLSYLIHFTCCLQKCSALLIGIIALAWFMILLMSAGPVIMDDTGSYHIQIIKWAQEYGTVPGLANLHERFGFNSAWLTLVSVFTPSHAAHNYYAALNGLLSLWLTAYLLVILWKSFDSVTSNVNQINPVGVLLMLLFAIICWPLIRGNAANSNYDFVTTCAVIVLFIEVWKQRKDLNPSKHFTTELLLWPVVLFTVRITNFPLLFLSLFAFVKLIRLKRTYLLFRLCSICAVLLIVFLARNTILSGYLFYPVYQIDFFSFDWKADPEAAKQIATFIKYFNRVPSLPAEEVQRLSFVNWIPLWFHDLQLYDKLVVTIGLSGFCFSTVFFRKTAGLNKQTLFYVSVLILQLVVWLFVAPDTRFAYGPLLAGCYLLGAVVETPAFILFVKPVKLPVCLLLAAAILLYSAIKIVRHRDYRNPLVPVLLPLPPVHVTRLSNLEIRTPDKILDNWNARCYGTDLPCLYKIHAGLQARTNNIKDGFKIEK